MLSSHPSKPDASERINQPDTVEDQTAPQPSLQKPQIDTTKKLTNREVVDVFEKDEKQFETVFKNSISTIESPTTGSITKIDLKPEHPTATIFLAPGWLETLDSNKYFFKTLFEMGYRVISLEHPRTGGKSKEAKTRHLDAIEAVIDSTELGNEKMFGLASSLGAIDLTEFANTGKNGSAHSKFKDLILLTPAGLTDENTKRFNGVLGLLKNYVAGHMKQGKTAKKDFSSLPDRATGISPKDDDGMPLTPIADAMRTKMTASGMRDLGKNPRLAFLEAVRVGSSHIQKDLQNLRKNGHKVFVFSTEKDRLLPDSEYKIQEGRDVDQLIQLAGYHNSFKTASKLDFDNEQWMGMVWIDSLIRHSLEKEKEKN